MASGSQLRGPVDEVRSHDRLHAEGSEPGSTTAMQRRIEKICAQVQCVSDTDTVIGFGVVGCKHHPVGFVQNCGSEKQGRFRVNKR